MSHPISEVLETTIERVRQMVDTSTVIGDPIAVGEVTLIPVTKVNIGFGSGGSDYVGKNAPAGGQNCFGGGAGAGVTVTPVGFLIVKGDSVRMLPVVDAPNGALDRAVQMIPELVDKVSEMLQQQKAKKEAVPAEDVE